MKLAWQTRVAVAVGTLLMGLTALAGTKAFTNDTGIVVTGIEIEFSADAMITWHSGELSAQGPSGFGTEFTFTGGEVKPGCTFAISWGPSVAKIVSYEWVTSFVSAASVEQHTLKKGFRIILRSADGQEITVQVTRRLSDRMIPFLVEYEVNEKDSLSFTWDMNHLVDLDLDGQFRNDADIVGQRARKIYLSNRTPYIVTLWAKDEEGAIYKGEDEIRFNAQNGDEILLDSEGFVAGVSSAKWSAFNGDAKDTNIRIAAPKQAETILASTYPDVTTVSLETLDSLGKTQEYDTTLYLFNKHPELFKYRGMVLSTIWIEDYEFLGRNLDFLKAIGVNSVRYPLYWHYSINDGGHYVIHNSGSEDPTDDYFLSQMISLPHQRGLGVELHLVVDPDPGVTIDRNHLPMSEKFFEGPQGYFAYLQHYIDIANKNNVEVLIGKTEMSCTDFLDARPWMDKLIEMMRTGLTDTRYTVESFFGQWNNPEPWNNNFGVDLSKLDEIDWSAWHMKVGPYAGASIQEIMASFDRYVLEPFIRTHNKFPDLKQRIGEFGFSSVKGGESSMSSGFDESVLDYDAQKKGYAALLRSLLDFVKSEGKDYFEGLFPHMYGIMRAFDHSYYNYVASADLFGKPALEVIYTFYSSEPQELPNIPIYCLWGKDKMNFYIDPYQDVKTVKPSGEVVQDFEGLGSHLSLPRVTNVTNISTIQTNFNKSQSYSGEQSLQIHYESPIGKVPHEAPYARGGEAVVLPKVPVESWNSIDSLSIAMKREDPNLGIVLLLFQKGSGYPLAYTQRLPLQKVGEWEDIGVLLKNFSKILGSENLTVGDLSDRSNLLPGRIGIGLYSISGGPVDTDVYIDGICVNRKVSD